jgi:hypothetical protein
VTGVSFRQQRHVRARASKRGARVIWSPCSHVLDTSSGLLRLSTADVRKEKGQQQGVRSFPTRPVQRRRLNMRDSVVCRTGLLPARPMPVTGPAPPVFKVSGRVHTLPHGAVPDLAPDAADAADEYRESVLSIPSSTTPHACPSSDLGIGRYNCPRHKCVHVDNRGAGRKCVHVDVFC